MSMEVEKHEMKRDNLWSAIQIMPVVPDKLTVAKAATALKRGTLLTSAGAACSDASDVYAVLAEDVDSTAAAVDAPVYLTGEFSESALAEATGITISADIKKAARANGIFIKKNN